VRRLGVEDAILSRLIEQLSTGECQRLAMVRAMQFKRDVLLLDEPAGPLDTRTTELVEGEIRNQMQNGVGVILVAHERAQTERLGAEVHTIVAGRLDPAPQPGAG
jgi:ABC-type iron transport system FetAB ATPase subunit